MPLELITVAVITGLAGGLHCLGMCGGLLGALGVGFTPRMSPTLPAGEDREGGGRAASEGNRGGEHRRDPVRAAPRHISEITRVVGYHLGRISTYAILGAICGALGSMALLADGLLPIQQVLYLVAQSSAGGPRTRRGAPVGAAAAACPGSHGQAHGRRDLSHRTGLGSGALCHGLQHAVTCLAGGQSA